VIQLPSPNVSDAILQQRLAKTPFSKILAAWDALDLNGTDVPAIRWLCLYDRYYLLVKMLRRYDAWHPWIYARCREVETSPDGHCDIWAREHYKSTIITFAGIVQEIIRNPEITVGIFSHTKPIAKSFLAQLQRELSVNLNLIHSFPEVFYENPEKDSPSWSLDAGITVKRQGNPKEATVEAHGLVDGQPTAKHFQLMVYDDVVTRESVNTPEQIQKTTEAWSLSDNLGTVGGRKWIIGTRYHYADTYSFIIERHSATLRKHPATHDGTLSGTPVLFTAEVWARKLIDQLEADVACQLLADPQAGHQRMFDIRDLRVYEYRPMTLMVYIMVDPAHSMRKGSDHTAMAVIGVDYAGNKYFLDGVDHRMELVDKWRNMRNLWEKWHAETGVQGCHVGYERYGAISDLAYFKEQMERERLSFEISELEWPRSGEGSKNDRVQRLTPDLKNHRFYLPYPTDPEHLTSGQQRRVNEGYGYCLSQRVRRLDQDKKLYDVTERLRMQFSYFPFCERKDLIDAVARIYDLEVRPPVYIDPGTLEPEYL
jgi:hypothetical protein